MNRKLRWWPAGLIVGVAVAVAVWIRLRADWSFQERNLGTLSTALGALVLLLLWWLILSGANWRARLALTAVVLGSFGTVLTLFRIRGVSGDLRPILELRWGRPRVSKAQNPASANLPGFAMAQRFDFPQFLGPDRNAQLNAPALGRDWDKTPPLILWRHPIGSGWSGWAIVGECAFTQEQRPEGECSTCYEISTGRQVWSHTEAAHYENVLAGEGPRCTPTVASNRVFTLGPTGLLNCLDLRTGKRLWSHNLVEDAQSRIPEWGFAGSPLVYDGKVIVSGGGQGDRSLLAYSIEKGDLLWHAGSRPASYGSPSLATLSGVRQILAFNSHHITSHDTASGEVLWEYPWGKGEPQAAAPVLVATNQVLFSSGYGIGTELLQIEKGADGGLTASRVWLSRKMKAKFANLIQREGFLYGLDDGILACIDLKDGTQRWKGGRYGHGQGLLIRDLFLLMAEDGELILLRPTPEGPNELHRFRVFNAKTWNPIALAGDLLLVRNDQEAACVHMPLEAK